MTTVRQIAAVTFFGVIGFFIGIFLLVLMNGHSPYPPDSVIVLFGLLGISGGVWVGALIEGD